MSWLGRWFGRWSGRWLGGASELPAGPPVPFDVRAIDGGFYVVAAPAIRVAVVAGAAYATLLPVPTVAVDAQTTHVRVIGGTR